jgi:3-hydroxyisobutyrate dehydrogenase-like beta-hydroxyacid dehydrogenase
VTVGFVGLGEMGAPMAANLAAGEFELTAFDPDPARVAALGVPCAANVRDVARAADVVYVCVRDERQLRTVASEVDAPGTTLVVHSTVGPRACRQIAEDLRAVSVTVVDAPISGMQMAAVAGTLTFFVGGADDAVERVLPGLEAMGSTILRVGDIGSGQVVKLANNLVAFGTAGLVLEAVSLAKTHDVEPETLLGALGRGTARSWVIEQWEFLTAGWAASQPGGSAAVEDIVAKDLGAVHRAFDEAGIDAPFAEVAGRVVPPALGRDA